MRFFYRLQQKISITSHEAAALAVLCTLFVGGLGVRTWQGASTADFSSAYLAVDSLFDAQAGRLRADLLSGAGDGILIGTPVVNINEADAEVLQLLPRIGPAMAQRIISYRNAHGNFRSPDDLLNVIGIGPKTLEQLLPMIITSAADST